MCRAAGHWPICRDYKGKDATGEVYKVDTALLADLRNHEGQAAQAVGPCDTKSETAASTRPTRRSKQGGLGARPAALSSRDLGAPLII
jgi:hypothetical protein